MSKTRTYCFTVNNFTPAAEQTLKSLAYKYLVFGREVGESGTPHLQGFIQYTSPKTFNTVKNQLPQGAHIESARGTPYEAAKYCKKDGDFYEDGTPPKSPQEKGAAGGAAEKRRWEEAFKAAQEGREDDIPGDIRLRQRNNIKKVRQDYLFDNRNLEDTEEQHLWYYGEAGSGKSRKAREENPDAYLKACNKWWCGYSHEDVVIIEDFDIKHEVLCHHMKIWGDRYRFRAEVKGSSMEIRPKKIIVTSNYHPMEIWHTDSNLKPILRRFKCVKFQLPISDNGH